MVLVLGRCRQEGFQDGEKQSRPVRERMGRQAEVEVPVRVREELRGAAQIMQRRALGQRQE